MRQFAAAILAILCTSSCVLATNYPFRNTTLTWDARVHDLVSRLSLQDMTLQMAKGGVGAKGGPGPAIPRLGIKPYSWNTECLRGDAGAGKATAFPQSIGLGAAFWPKLIFDVAEATGEEVRAKYNDFVHKGQYGDHKGISCFSPVINIMRHPLWGRNQETYGEDPTLSGMYAASYVQGLQGHHPRYIRANAGCKHFDVHGGPENIPSSRFSFDAKVSERDWRLTFLPSFRHCVWAGAYSLMCSFNKINGVPSCANKKLLTDVLRKEWNFTGYVISDQGALQIMIDHHHYYNTTQQVAVGSVSAGCNLALTNDDPKIYLTIPNAVREKKLTSDLVRERVKPLFYTRMRLGEFDPPAMNPYTKYNLSLVQNTAHTELAVKAALKTFVLLKNEKGLLPVKKNFSKIAIVGPMANNLKQLYGDYGADPDPALAKTPLQGLKSLAHVVNYKAGCPDNKCVHYDAQSVKSAVVGAELVVICVGTGQELESEGNDRSSMELAGHQKQLILDAVAASSGKPVVLLVFSGGPVNITFADKDPRIGAIVQCFFPAQATGEALYAMMTLNRPDANPAGRLPYTWYMKKSQIPSMTNYSMVGRTYRYFKGEPLYPFGYGLSYTTFQYMKATVNASIHAGSNQTVTGEVHNTGSRDGDEVVQCYISWTLSGINETMPQRQLVAFDRFHVKKDTTQQFAFTITPEQMAVWTDSQGYVVKPGKLTIFVGGQQPEQKRSTGSNMIHKMFEIKGTKVLGKF